MSGTIFGLNDQRWNASRSAFFWTLQSMSARAADPRLAATLLERFTDEVHWLDLQAFTPSEQRDLLTLLRDTPAAARRDLPSFDGRDAVITQIDRLIALVDGSGTPG